MRTVKSAKPNNTNTSDEKAKHYINVYQNNVQVGYMVIDANPELVKKCQNDEEFINRFFKHDSVSAVYREAGKTTKQLSLDDI